MENAQPEVHIQRKPSDRVYAAIHWTCMAIIGAILLNGLLISRWWPMPRPVGFRVFVFMLLTFNVLWWSIADRRIARHIASARLARWLRWGIVGFCGALNLPIFYGLVVGRVPPLVSNPTWYTAAVTLWHVALPMALPLVASVRLAALGAQALARRTFTEPTAASVRENEVFDPTRRALLKTAFASVPVAMLAGGTAWGRWQIGGFNVHRHALAAPWLPDRLKGLTITQVSDLHVGRLYRPDMLAHLVEQVNGLKSDIIVVTGDVVDSSNQMLPPAIDALGQFTSRHGTYLCMGNHDEFDDRLEFIRAVRERLPLLINERRTLEIGGERLTLAGVDYANEPEPTRRRAGDIANVAETLKGHDAQSDGPVIALAHHPHTWDILQLHGVPLTLSGHTHGGQIMMTPPGGVDLGLGRALFRYIRGFYRTDESTLFVNSGVGNWFPIRINAPAEIVQIQLV